MTLRMAARAAAGSLLVALALLAYLLVQRRRRRYVVRFTNLDLLENVVAELAALAPARAAALTLLALAALVVGTGAAGGRRGAVPRQQATVILTMDRSGSMTATDVAARPDDRGARGGGLVRRRAARRLQGRRRLRSRTRPT